jgi:tRNA (guanine26-N2/guanine27-N2)-dimethyltransferase
MYATITEGQATVNVLPEAKISKKLPVFYNPVMQFNRDMSVLLLKALGKKDIKVGDPLAGTGIRGIRFLKELPEDIVASVWMNDYNERFIPSVKEALALNDVRPEAVPVQSFFDKQMKFRTSAGFKEDVVGSAFTAYNKRVVLATIDANLFLLLTPGFDFIDIDPFGSPNPFLEAACMRLARDGILAVTATDTSALCGTYCNACRRKYWAEPMHNELMHEVGLRILIRKVQLVGAQYDKALIPIFSYDRDHYMRVFFRCKKAKAEVDKVLQKHEMFSWHGQAAGPLWAGALWDKDLVNKMYALEKDSENNKFLGILAEEAAIPVVGFYDIHALCKREKIKDIPQTHIILGRLEEKGFSVSRTHFSLTGFRSDAPIEEVLFALKKR